MWETHPPLYPRFQMTDREQSNKRSCRMIDIVLRNPPISYERTLSEFRRHWIQLCKDKADRLASGRKICRLLENPGVMRIKRIVRDFNSALDTWQSYQSDVFFNMLNCNKQLVLGNDYINCVSMINEQYGWKDEPDECLVIAYRGSGKSTLLVHVIAAFLKNIPNYDAMTYSGNLPKSKDFLNGIWSAFQNMINSDTEFKDAYFTTKTSTQISVWAKDDSIKDKRTIRTTSSLSKNVSKYFFFIRSPIKKKKNVCMCVYIYYLIK